MDPLLQRIINLLIAPPGNLVFHLVLAFAILAALQAVWILRQSGDYPHSGRILFGLGMLLLAQVLLFLSSGLAWQNVVDPHLLLPPLDRAVFAFSLVWVVWLWGFEKPARLADMVTGFLSLVVILLFLFTFTSWSVQGAGLSFNNSWMDWVWELAGAIIVLTGMAILLLSRPTGWGFGFGMLLLSLSGLAAHILFIEPSKDFSGYLRIAQLAAFPLLPTLLYRYSEARKPAVITSAVETPAIAAYAEPKRSAGNVHALHAFLELKKQEDFPSVTAGMAKAIAYLMSADLCYIVLQQTAKQITLFPGYDMAKEEQVNGVTLQESQVPLLASALQKSEVVRISSGDRLPPDSLALAKILGIQATGTLLLIPLTLNGQPWGAVLLLSPYSEREWTSEDEAVLSVEAENIAQILRDAQVPPISTPSPAVGAAEITLQNLRAEMENYQSENENLLTLLEKSRIEIEETRQSAQKSTTAAPSAELESLVALQRESQETINLLQTENEELRLKLEDFKAQFQQAAIVAVQHHATTEESDRLEAELRATLQDLAALQNQLAETNVKVMILESKQREALPRELSEGEVITSMVQDLRQPMVSIMGYTDLLLAESVGILGALQRKFLERIRASSERMRSMLNDLIQVAAAGEPTQDLLNRPVDLGTLIDGAMLDTSAQIREKDITLLVDLPEEMPTIYAQRDIIQQIIVHLLQNASAITPQEGTVTLRTRVHEDEGKENLLLQVMDSGGGISEKQIEEVFKPHYRPDAPLIAGLGDTGVGLAITKAIVETSGGRIWVESEPGVSTTFNVLFPINGSSTEAAS